MPGKGESTINLVIYLFTPMAGTILLLIFMRMLMEHRMKWWLIPLTALAMEAVMIPRFRFGIESFPSIAANLICMVAVLIILPLVLFQGTWWKRILMSVYLWTVLMLCDLLCSSYFIPTYGTDFMIWPLRELVSYMILSLLLFTAFGSVSVLVLRQVAARQFQPFYLLFLVFPMGLWMMAYGYLFEGMKWLWYLGVLVSMGAQISLLIYTVDREKRASLEQELKDTRHVMELEQAHYRLVEERREELARIRHDFNNQLAAVGQLIRMGEDEDAQQMIGQLAQDIEGTRENVYCAIPVVNAVLAEKSALCAQEGIALEARLDLPHDCQVEPLQLCSAFSNLLDNAIRGARESGAPGPWVQLGAMADGDYLFIRTKNPAVQPPEKPLPGHGYGTRILDSLAAQYDGAYQTRFEDGVYTALLSLTVRQ